MPDLEQLLQYALNGWAANGNDEGCERLNPDDTATVVLRAIRVMDGGLQGASPDSFEERVRSALGKAYQDIERLRYAPAGQQAEWLKPIGSTEKYDPLKQRFEDTAVGYADGEKDRIKATTGKEGRGVNTSVAKSFGVSSKTLAAWRASYEASQARQEPDLTRRQNYDMAKSGQWFAHGIAHQADENVGRLEFAVAEGLAYRALVRRRALNRSSLS